MLLHYECPLCLISDALILRFSFPSFTEIYAESFPSQKLLIEPKSISVVFEIRKIEFQSFSSGKRIITYQNLPWVAGWISGGML